MNEIHDFFHQPRAFMLTVFVVILLIWVLAWDDTPKPTEKRKGQPPSSIDYRHRTRQFNFDSLILKMNAYYQLMVDDHVKKQVNRQEISNMLFGFHQERRRLYNYLDVLKKNKHQKLSARKERSLRHYLQSTESCIEDLKKRLKNRPETFSKNE